MSTIPAVTMQDLELEHAELLPRRETLTTGWSGPNSGHSSSFNAFNQVNGSNNGNGDGNTHQYGGGFLGNVSVGNGNLDGNLSGNNVQIF